MRIDLPKIFLIFIFSSILFWISDSCFSQTDNIFTIEPGCPLNDNTKGKELLAYMSSNNIQNYTSDGKTIYLILVNLDIGIVSFLPGINPQPLDQTLRGIFTGWASCKADIDAKTRTGRVDTSNILTPFTQIPKEVGEEPKFASFTPITNWRQILSLDYYVNPYFQAFGGDPLGLPIAYGPGIGLTVAFGTPYSGPMETDFVKGGIHIGPFEVAVTSRVKAFVIKYSANTNRTEDLRNTWLGNWNNLYSPHLGIEAAIEIPAIRFSYFSTIDTLQDVTDNPIIVRDLSTGLPMKNNVVRNEYFGMEIRTPNLVVLQSRRSKLYFARHFGEWHLGFVGREMKVDALIFDFRMNATFPGKRNFQVLTELLFDSPWAGFANKSFGFGPSIRIGKTPTESFGIISFFINARIKVGDFFDRKLYD